MCKKTHVLTTAFLCVSEQVSLVYLEYLEVVVHLDPPSLAQGGRLAYLAHLAQWGHQVRKRKPNALFFLSFLALGLQLCSEKSCFLLIIFRL